MAFIKKGTLTVADDTTAQFLNLGFVPSYFKMTNKTKIVGTTNGVVIAEWYDDMANDTAYIWTTSSGDGTNKLTIQATNGITPFQTPDEFLYVPFSASNPTSTAVYQANESTNLVVTNISNAANASVTATHSFTSADIGVTVVTFHIVDRESMIQINTLSGIIQSVTSTTSFTVNINTTNFTSFNNATPEIANVITGAPANTLYGNVSLPTAQANLGFIGLLLGSALMVDEDDVWEYVAMLDTPVTS